MKKLAFFLLFIVCGIAYAQQNLDSAIQNAAIRIQNELPQGTRVAVLNFSSSSEQFSGYVIEEIMDVLTNGRRLNVVERQRLDDLRREMNFQMSGDVSDETMMSIGKMLGAQSIVTGSITDTGTSYRFRVYAINVENANREASTSLNLNINDQQINFLLTGRRPTQQPNTQAFRIGDTGPAGGIIFYDKGNNSDGWRYLEVSPSTTDRVDQNVFSATAIYGQVSNRSVGAGLNNTRMYIERLHRNNVPANTALHYSNNLIHNGFNDWFLPSIEELRLMYNNLRNNSSAGFLPRKYWSSTCNSQGSALFIDFSNGQETLGDWSGTMRIRAIRRF